MSDVEAVPIGTVPEAVPRQLRRNGRNGAATPVEMTGMTVMPGQIITLSESDYQFGVGTLRLRVVRVEWACVVTYNGENWYQVYGVQVAADGSPLRTRQVLVRGSRLGAADRH